MTIPTIIWRIRLAVPLCCIAMPFTATSASEIPAATVGRPAFLAGPVATPAPSNAPGCTIDPRPVEDFIRVDTESQDALSAMLGTPGATPLPPSGGVPANSAVIAAVTKTMHEVTACINATDLRRLSALLTDDQFRRTFGGIGEEMLTGLGTPTGLPEGERAPYIAVEQVMVLPDGRVSAITGAEGREALTVFKKVGDRYLIDASYIPPPGGTSVP